MEEVLNATEGHYEVYQDEDVLGYVLTHVDDIIYSGDELVMRRLERKLEQEYSCVDVDVLREDTPIDFCGKRLEMQLEETGEFRVKVTQENYAKRISPLEEAEVRRWHQIKGKQDPRNPNRARSPIRKRCGELLWVLRTRFDISYSVGEISREVDLWERDEEAAVLGLDLINGAIEYLSLLPSLPIIVRRNKMETRRLVVLTDASVNSADVKCVAAHLIMLAGDRCGDAAALKAEEDRVSSFLVMDDFAGDNMAATTIKWNSKTPKRVFRSSSGGELLAARAASSEVSLLMGQIAELGLISGDRTSAILLSDSKNIVYSSAIPPAEKNLTADWHVLMQMRRESVLVHEHLPGVSNLADLGTKERSRTRLVLPQYVALALYGILGRAASAVIRGAPLEFKRYEE